MYTNDSQIMHNNTIKITWLYTITQLDTWAQFYLINYSNRFNKIIQLHNMYTQINKIHYVRSDQIKLILFLPKVHKC